MRAPLVAFASVLALSGCAIVDVHTPDGRAHLSVWPLGVRVASDGAQALSVSVRAVGVSSGCYSATLGASSVDCDVIDPKVCTAAIVHAKINNPDFLDRLTRATRAYCPQPTKEN